MTGNAFDEAAAIDAFWGARERGCFFPREWFDRLSFEQAYRVQLGVMRRRLAAGATLVGWKVAQTSAAARRSFGFAEPVFGSIMRDGVRRSGHVYGRDDLIQPRCEPEVCIRMKHALSGSTDPRQVRQAIDAIYPSLEIIEVRGDIPGQKTLAIADNAATKDIVLGEPVPFRDDMDLVSLQCRFQLNDDDATHGTGADVLGDPLNAVVWLAGKLAQFGVALRAGDLVMTGSLTAPVPLSPGDRARAELGGLSPVTMSIAA